MGLVWDRACVIFGLRALDQGFTIMAIVTKKEKGNVTPCWRLDVVHCYYEVKG